MRSSEISIAVRPESKIKYPITTRFDGVHFDIRHFIFFFFPKETIPAPTSKSVSNSQPGNAFSARFSNLGEV
jgi:hypothetical protein